MATDPTGGKLSYLLCRRPAAASSDAQTGLLQWVAPTGGADHIDFELRAIGPSGSYARQTWTVAVTGLNRPPVLVPVSDQSTQVGQTLQIHFSAVDPESGTVTYRLDNLPAGSSFDARSSTLTWTPGGQQAGTYPGVKVTASDGVNDVAATFTITVKPGALPPNFVQPVDRTVTEAIPLSVRLQASDPEGAALTFSSPDLPNGAVLVPGTGQFLWTPSYAQHGTYTVEFDVTNGAATTSRTMTITVLNVNGPIRFVPLDTLVVQQGQALSVRVIAIDSNVPAASDVALTGSAAVGTDRQSTLTYAASGLPVGATRSGHQSAEMVSDVESVWRFHHQLYR